MNKEILEELIELKNEIGMSQIAFNEIIYLAMEYKNNENPTISDEELIDIIKETMMVCDYSMGHIEEEPLNETDEMFLEEVYRKRKTISMSFKEALQRLEYIEEVRKIK